MSDDNQTIHDVYPDWWPRDGMTVKQFLDVVGRVGFYPDVCEACQELLFTGASAHEHTTACNDASETAGVGLQGLLLLTRPQRALPDEAQVHRDGLGLADSMTIYADARDPESGNASHQYEVVMRQGARERSVAQIRFQHGPRNAPGSRPGVLDGALIAVLLDRFRGFQSGKFASRENALVITKLEEALLWIKDRAWKRHAQNVLGQNKNHVEPK